MSKPVRHGDKWRIRWFDAAGKRKSAVYDDYKRAQTELVRRLAEAEDVRRGTRDPEPEDKTVNDLCDYWVEKRAPRKRSKKDDLSIIRKHLRPYFGHMLVKAVGTEDGDDYVNLKIDGEGLGDKYVHNHLTLFGTMLRAAAAFKIPWILKVPRFNKPRLSLFSTDYAWLRTDDEIARFLRAARAEGEMVFMLYAVAVFTGLRAGELAALEWPDIDLERRLITVHHSYSGPTKSGRIRHVPILDALLSLLKAWRLRHPGRLVFANLAGTMLQPSARIFQEVLHRVLDAAKLPNVIRGGKERPYVTFHGLRHTFASHWVVKGGDIFKLQKILGHASIAMTQRYAHLAPEAFASDYGRLGGGLPLDGAAVIDLPAHG
ncbi:MAG TPA: tyrosine-type recombinase/integrase [Polyangiaceae bacterium]